MDRSKVKVVATRTWQFADTTTTAPLGSNSTTAGPSLTKSPASASPFKQTPMSPPSKHPSKPLHHHQRGLKNPSDVDFINDTDFIVCDSDLHCVHLFTLAEEENGGGGDDDDEDKHDGDDDDDTKNVSNNHPSQNASGSYDGLNVRGYDHKVLLWEQVWPSCVVVTRDGKVRLTDRKNKSVKTFDLETEELLSEWGQEGESTMAPQGVAVCRGGETVVTDSMNNCVWVLDEKGQVLRSFGGEGDLLDQFRLPFYACVDDKDNILVSDNMNYCVKSFDLRGNFLIRIGSGHLFGQRKFQSPYGVTYDSGNDEILVADNDTNRIFTYDKQGTFLRYAVSGLECESPCGIGIRNNRLVVSLSNPDHCNVKLFMLEEK